MTFLDDLGLRAAEQLEMSVGAYVALASYKRLLGAEQPVRGKAALGALRAAIDLGDDAEIRALLPVWESETKHDVDASGFALKLLARKPVLAAEMARAELTRRPTALAAYVGARIADVRRSDEALSLWDRTIALAHAQRDDRILAAAVARWLELALFSTEPPLFANGVRQAVAERADLVPIEAAQPHERLLLARARLLSASKFKRASALSVLVDLAKTASDSVRRSAVLVAAWHADSTAGRLDPVEADRVRAALAQWPVEAERDAALARSTTQSEIERHRRAPLPASELDALVGRIGREAPEMSQEAHRVRALFSGGVAGGARASDDQGGGLDARLSCLGIDAVAAIARGSFAEAARSLVRAREALPPIAAVPQSLHVASTLGLAKPDAVLRRAAAMFLTRAIERSFTVPPGGFVVPAVALVRAGFFTEGKTLLAEARRLKEPGATRMLAEVERKLAFDALRKGDRAGALDGLRSARSLFAEADPAV